MGGRRGVADGRPKPEPLRRHHQLPGMPGCAEGEGLAGPGPPHDQGDT
jgi:hypothetical protein